MLAVQMDPPQVPLEPPPSSGFAREAEASRPLIRAVVAAILREGRMHPDVDDCTSEALRRALEGRQRLRAGEPVRPWLLGIARHVALDRVRVRQRDLRRHVQPTADGLESPVDRVPDSAPGADERLERARRMAAIRGAMDQLPAEHREALELFHVEGLAYREISERLSVPIGTVCTWIARGRRAIAVALGETGENA